MRERLALEDLLAFFAPYLLRACFSQASRFFCLCLYFALHDFSAFASCCARLSGFGFGFDVVFDPRTCCCVTLPELDVVWLPGVANGGGGAFGGAGRHASSSHGG
ncbi:MAG TPA: hypothetical protein VF706_00885, partial [Solirubrobacteraceae bacterium]